MTTDAADAHDHAPAAPSSETIESNLKQTPLQSSETRTPVLRNTLFLIAAQVLVTPISVLVNAVSARSLGPAEFGRLYLATTFATFAFLLVEWGQQGTLTGKVAVARHRAGELLGAGLAWRIFASMVIWIVLPITCWLAGYETNFIIVLGLVLVVSTLLTVASACQDVLRGFERTDFAAATYVGWQLLTAAVVVPLLLLGGNLRTLLVAQVACATAGAAFVLWMLPKMHVPKLALRSHILRELFVSGQPFLIFAIAMNLQPLVDVAMLGKFAPADAIGWHAAARKLIGILIYPAAALVAALYPTLCRLCLEDSQAFRKATVDALHVVTIVVVPLALGCALFPSIGIAIFSERSYGPAEDNLRVLALYVLLVYFSMPLSTCINASGRQSIWAVVQLACVVVSVLADPPLIRWFQEHHNNGGLGVCVATVASEILMVGAGMLLVPKGVLNTALARKLGLALLAGGSMAAVAIALRQYAPLIVAPLAFTAYVACLWITGTIDAGQLRAARALLRR